MKPLSAEEIVKMREACRVSAEVLDRTCRFVKEGVTAYDIDRFAKQTMAELGCTSPCIGYKPSSSIPAFPRYICVSVNEEVIHGIGTLERVIRDGDIVSLDDIFNLEVGVAHLDTQCLSLVAARYGTAVVRREHDDWPPNEVGAEETLTRDVEVVAVGEGEHLYLFYYIGNDTPDDKLVLGVYLDGAKAAIALVGRHKTYPAVANLNTLNGILAIDIADSLAVVIWLHGTVDDDYIAIVHRLVDHRDTIDTKEERRRLVSDKELHKVQLLAYILRRRGKARLNIAHHQALKRSAVVDSVGS